MRKILITDSLFIFREHEKLLADAGFAFERLDKASPTEDELISALGGKEGYILGGIEKLTDKVIDGADSLKAIVFTGIGYKDFIPNYEYVTQKGIAIANTPDGPTYAVAEWALAMALAMNRNIFDLGRLGEKNFMTSKGIEGQRVGIIGLGRIGSQIVRMIRNFRPAGISYYSKHRHEDVEEELDISYLEFKKLLSESDIIFLCVSKEAGDNFIGKSELAVMKEGALLISCMSPGIVDDEALLSELKTGRIRAASDHPMKDESSKNLPLGVWYCFNASNAFNTFNELKITSDMATRSIINLLTTGQDKNKVN
jgi:glyoxylate reductase